MPFYSYFFYSVLNAFSGGLQSAECCPQPVARQLLCWRHYRPTFNFHTDRPVLELTLILPCPACYACHT